MKIRLKKSLRTLVLLALAAISSMVWVSLSQAGEASEAEKENGSRLWSQQCGHCHNKRSPDKYSDAQWDVIVHHMRVRANLNGSEARAIVDFLKSAN